MFDGFVASIASLWHLFHVIPFFIYHFFSCIYVYIYLYTGYVFIFNNFGSCRMFDSWFYSFHPLSFASSSFNESCWWNQVDACAAVNLMMVSSVMIGAPHVGRSSCPSTWNRFGETLEMMSLDWGMALCKKTTWTRYFSGLSNFHLGGLGHAERVPLKAGENETV